MPEKLGEGSSASSDSSSFQDGDVHVRLVENPLQGLPKKVYQRNLLRKTSVEQGNDVAAFLDEEWYADGLGKGSPYQTCSSVSGAPKDRFHLAYIIFYLLGFGTLLPWNFFITANAYFSEKLATHGNLQMSFQNYFSVASMGPNALTMILNVFFLHRLNRWRSMSLALVVMFLLFALTAALVIINTDKWTGTFFAITLASMVVINSCSAVLQGGLFGVTGLLPTRYTQALMGGQGLSGVFAAVVSILAGFGNSSIFESTFGYFCCAAFVILLCLLGFFVIQKLEYVKYYIGGKKYTCTCKCDAFVHDHMLDFVNEDAVARKTNKNTNENNRKMPFFKIFRQILPMAASVFFVFCVTLTAFPSITARIQSVNKSDGSDWTNKFFVPVTCFLLFNVGDYAGRTLAGFVQKPGSNGYWLLALCLGRVIFIPLFAFCNAQSRPNGTPVIFQHDAAPIIFMILFSTTNGYLGSLAMMYGPRMVDSSHAEVAGTTMAFCLVIGLFAGSGFSFVATMFL